MPKISNHRQLLPCAQSIPTQKLLVRICDAQSVNGEMLVRVGDVEENESFLEIGHMEDLLL
jgi:hypothetical protein